MVQSRKASLIITALLVFFSSGAFVFDTDANHLVPVTGSTTSNQPETLAAPIQSLSEFSATIQDGEDLIRGVYVEDVLAFRVVQQPANNPGYVSSINNLVTQFGMASDYGTVGLLAHNFAAGSFFPAIELGDEVQTITGTGETEAYQVVEILSFQALSPDSQTSAFVDLSTGEQLTAGQLFEQVYTGDPHLVMQTCIADGNEDSWGRLFIIAEPVEETL